MRMLVALVVLLAIASTATAWELKDQLEYTYTKTMEQQAGDDIVKPSLVGAVSEASFFDPGNIDDGVYNSTAHVKNNLTGILVDRNIYFPSADLTGADFAATLTQGGSATVNLRAMNCYDNTIPEMYGDAKAYQNLEILGGFDTAAAEFDSEAKVGADGIWVVTETLPDTDTTQAPIAYVDAQRFGAGEICAATLGEQVVADFSRGWDGTGWNVADYSGGIKMWALFDAACDPGCANPIVSSVDGDAWTAIFPGDPTIPEWGGDSYWGDDWETDPEPQADAAAGGFPDTGTGVDGEDDNAHGTISPDDFEAVIP